MKGGDEVVHSVLLAWVVELARRDIMRTQTDFVGRMHQAMGGFEAVCDEYPDGEWPEDARDDAAENLAALAGLALAQLAIVQDGPNALAAPAASRHAPDERQRWRWGVSGFRLLIVSFGAGAGACFAMFGIVVGFGQTFGQRCERMYPRGDAIQIERCVDSLAHGGRP